MYTGSMYGAGAHVFAVWGYVIAHTKHSDSSVELNARLLAATIGEPADRIQAAIDLLCAPDPNSRTPDEQGRRLIKEGSFLYRVVNDAKYHKMLDDDARRDYQREWVKGKRKKSVDKRLSPSSSVDTSLSPSSSVDTSLSSSTQEEEEEEEEERTTTTAQTAAPGEPAQTSTVSGPKASLPPAEDSNQWTTPTATTAATAIQSESTNAEPPPILTFKCLGTPNLWHLTAQQLAEWESVFGDNVNVLEHVTAEQANKPKTAMNMIHHLSSGLRKAQRDALSLTNAHIPALYQAYPRHVGKEPAFKAIDKALQSVTFEVLLEAVEAFARSPAGQAGEFTPHPATWFNSRRWEDDRKEWNRDNRRQSNTSATAIQTPGYDDEIRRAMAARALADAAEDQAAVPY